MDRSSLPRLSSSKYRRNFHRRGLSFFLLLAAILVWRVLVLAEAWQEHQRLQRNEQNVAKVVRRP
jgi:hypothetical protein